MKVYLDKIDKFLADLFKKAPALPVSAKDVIVKVAPWLALVSALLAIPGLLAMLNISMWSVPYYYAYRTNVLWIVAAFITAISVVLSLVAFQPLLKLKKMGWDLMLYGCLLGAISTLLHGNGVGLIVVVVELYLLYQVKASYK